ncbi:3-deoxy-D-manno-octulosonic acid kinase [Larsenimonas rhizosphaerae]|uniref:3-deoxy-D-manno-octulosonic acid kinase n=1 Tax=Larsenimonas rhizosphaerae TaxID=2944682 RepID=A0AA41ZH02_9GAMM|nr:3-deoxy-D-manno-octulosonic acid kinase [Larsenimonas rhizosphaerae]MCM2129326.1 3-deoxy-D-manno-octulosonic acid kinase [Larsenimonas rhizosphaerae]MCX2523979.1 3-deoxy-D-manno-octulosonic acid kinase [Larsenimonas rhizosphaerae]
MRLQISRKANTAILYDAERAPQIEPDWFMPEWWENQQAITGRAPGRGESLFLSREDQQWVLRPYRRGGLIGRVVREHYVWTRLEATRAFRECRLTARLQQAGLPVPAPVGACVWRHGLTYRAALLTVRISGAHALATCLEEGRADHALLHDVGRMIRRFHDHGLDHVDLNARNILIDEAHTPWLIDLDRCQLRAGERFKARNLERLSRSFEKFAGTHSQRLYTALLHGYNA